MIINTFKKCKLEFTKNSKHPSANPSTNISNLLLQLNNSLVTNLQLIHYNLNTTHITITLCKMTILTSKLETTHEQVKTFPHFKEAKKTQSIVASLTNSSNTFNHTTSNSVVLLTRMIRARHFKSELMHLHSNQSCIEIMLATFNSRLKRTLISGNIIGDRLTSWPSSNNHLFKNMIPNLMLVIFSRMHNHLMTLLQPRKISIHCFYHLKTSSIKILIKILLKHSAKFKALSTSSKRKEPTF